jgi:hypothetical protein
MDRPISLYGADMGLPHVVRYDTEPNLLISHTFIFTSKADRRTFVTFFKDKLGSWKAFWVPTWAHEFRVYSDAVAGATNWEVHGDSTDFVDALEQRSPMAVFFYWQGLSDFTQALTVSSVSYGGSSITFNAGSTLQAGITADQTFHWLIPSRFAGDNLQTFYPHPDLMQTTVNFTEVRGELTTVV